MLEVALEHLVFAQGMLAQVPEDLGDVRPNLADVVWDLRRKVKASRDASR